MKRTPKLPWMLSMLACSILVGCIAHSTISTRKEYDISIDPCLSSVTHINIINTLYDFPVDHSPVSIAQLLHAHFPCIRAVKTHKNARGITTFIIEAHAPCFALNDSALMLNNNCVVDRGLYNEAQLVGIKRVTVAQQQLTTLPSSFKTSIEHIVALYPSAAIHWHEEHQIAFTAQENPAMCIVCSDNALPDQLLMQRCAHVCAQLQKNRETDAKKQQRQSATLLTDIRFKNQIVVRAEVGEHKYG